MSYRSHRNIIFDLDGTLIDSYPGIRASLNYAIRFPDSKLCLRGLRKKIGPPISKMVNSLWPKLDQKSYEKILQRFRRHYDREGCLRSRMYPGARQMLAGIKKPEKSFFTDKQAGYGDEQDPVPLENRKFFCRSSLS